MNKYDAMTLIQYKLGINDLWDESNFFTVYYNLGDKKDLVWCHSAHDAIMFIHENLNDNHKIAIEFDDYFFESFDDIDKILEEEEEE